MVCACVCVWCTFVGLCGSTATGVLCVGIGSDPFVGNHCSLAETGLLSTVTSIVMLL